MLIPVTGLSSIRLAKLIRDDMVLPRDADVETWGWVDEISNSVAVRYAWQVIPIRLIYITKKGCPRLRFEQITKKADNKHTIIVK